MTLQDALGSRRVTQKRGIQMARYIVACFVGYAVAALPALAMQAGK
jgi:hypothetical protein